MSADDPTSAAYANEQEINRLNKIAEDNRKLAEAEVAEAKAASDAMVSEAETQSQEHAAIAYTAITEGNTAAQEALAALGQGEPLQDAALPDPIELPPEVLPDPPHPEQLPA